MRYGSWLALGVLAGCGIETGSLAPIAAIAVDGGAPYDAAVEPGRDAEVANDAAAGPDAATDAGVDAGLPPAVVPSFGEPDLVVDVSSFEDDRDPAPSADGRWLVFERPDGRGRGGRVLWLASDTDGDGIWRDERVVTELNTDADDSNATWWHDGVGSWLYWVTNWHDDGRTDRDVLVASFDPGRGLFAAGAVVQTIATAGDDSDPALSADGRIMVLQRPVDGRRSEIFQARGEALDAWGGAVRLAEVTSIADDYDPTISSDARILVFASDREPSVSLDLWVAIRQSVDDPFDPPERLPVGPGLVNQDDSNEFDCTLDAQGDLWFASDRLGDADLFTAPLL